MGQDENGRGFLITTKFQFSERHENDIEINVSQICRKVLDNQYPLAAQVFVVFLLLWNVYIVELRKTIDYGNNQNISLPLAHVVFGLCVYNLCGRQCFYA